MKRELLIFGSQGALGTGAAKILLSKNFDKVYLFDSKLKTETISEKNEHIQIKDLSIEKNVIEAFSHVKTDKETLFFLFSTVGSYWGGQKIWETKLEDFERMIKTNLYSNFLIAKHFSWIVKLSAGGSICFTSAFTASHPEALKSAYGASKNALEHLVKSFATESPEINLSVNAIAPYIIDTPANRAWMPDADYRKWIKPEEIGELVFTLFNNFKIVNGNIILLKENL